MTVALGNIDLRDRINAFFRDSFATDNALITEAIRRMLDAGGKRFRPLISPRMPQNSFEFGGREEYLNGLQEFKFQRGGWTKSYRTMVKV